MKRHGAEIKRIEAGLYETTCGRWEIRDTYDPSGAPHVRNSKTSNRWLITNRKTGKYSRDTTLDGALWQIGMSLRAMASK